LTTTGIPIPAWTTSLNLVIYMLTRNAFYVTGTHTAMPVASVGDTADATMTIEPADIEAYADLVGDTNPIHVDDDYADETMFDGRVAHGMLSAGVVSAALADLPGDVVYLAQDLAFEAPVRPDDTVTATAEVVESLGNDQLRVETTVTATSPDTTEDTVVLSGEATVMSVPHEPDPEDATAAADADESTDAEPTEATESTDAAAAADREREVGAESCDD
jgi:3-hydroxybutyryl-CoA dehydratase